MSFSKPNRRELLGYGASAALGALGFAGLEYRAELGKAVGEFFFKPEAWTDADHYRWLASLRQRANQTPDVSDRERVLAQLHNSYLYQDAYAKAKTIEHVYIPLVEGLEYAPEPVEEKVEPLFSVGADGAYDALADQYDKRLVRTYQLAGPVRIAELVNLIFDARENQGRPVTERVLVERGCLVVDFVGRFIETELGDAYAQSTVTSLETLEPAILARFLAIQQDDGPNIYNGNLGSAISFLRRHQSPRP